MITRLPLRQSVPLLLFFLGLVLTVGSVSLEIRESTRNIELSSEQSVKFLGSFASSTIEQDLKHRDLVMADTRVQLLATRPLSEAVALINENDQVIFSSIPKFSNQSFDHSFNQNLLFSKEDLKQIRETFTPQTRFAAHGNQLIGLFPVRLGSSIQNSFTLGPSRVGLLLTKTNIAALKSEAREGSVQRHLATFVFLAGAMLLSWWLLNRFITSRVGRLLRTIRSLAQGDFRASATLKGNDELAQLSQAFDEMARELAAKTAIDQERLRLADIVESSVDFIGSFSPDGKIIYLNTNGRKLLGYSATENLEGQSLGLFYSPASFQTILKTGIPTALKSGTWSAETELCSKDGRQISISQNIIAHRKANGDIDFLSTIGRDLTERKLNELNLRHAISARDEFLSIASHELKTPLAALKLQLQMRKKSLSKKDAPPPPAEAVIFELNMSLKQVESLTNLVDDLLDISRIQAGRFHLNVEKTNLAGVTADIVSRYRDQLNDAGCTVTTDLDESVEGLWDHFRIEQILVNLIGNLVKYAPKCRATIAVQKTGDFALLTVEDTGPGIPFEKQIKIFEPFERCNQNQSVSGLGLGLFVVRKIVQAHHGTINVESCPGLGTKFIVQLPFSPQQQMVYEETMTPTGWPSLNSEGHRERKEECEFSS